MADTSLFTRLQRLFSSDVIIRNVGGKQLKVMDTGRIQKYGNLATNSLYDRFTRLHKPVGSSLQYNPTLNYQSMRLQLYSDYEAMDHDPIIAAALDMVKNFRKKHDTPIIIFGYFNPFLQYGLNKVMREIKKAGANGVLIVDLPPEEAYETQQAVNKGGIEMVYLLAPTSTKERINTVAKLSNSFIYLVSVTGVTGARKKLDKNLEKFISKIKIITRKPVCVGFGISTKKHVKDLKKQANGIVISSAIIKIIEENLNKNSTMITKLNKFISSIKKSTFY